MSTENVEEPVNETGEEEEEIEQVNVEEVTKELIGQIKPNLSVLQRTTVNRGYAYVKLDYAEKDLNHIYNALEAFKQIKYLDLSKNSLKTIEGVVHCKNLITLNVSENELSDVDFLTNSQFSFHYLKKLDLSKNKLKSFSSKVTANLNHLILNGNEINTIDLDNLLALIVIEVRSNKLNTIENIDKCGLIEEVYAAENELTTLNLFQSLLKLKKLHLRKNKIDQVELASEQWLPSLEYLNLRENLIKEEESVKRIIQIKKLKQFNVLANPVCEENEDLIPRLFEQHFLTEEFQRSKLKRDRAYLI